MSNKGKTREAEQLATLKQRQADAAIQTAEQERVRASKLAEEKMILPGEAQLVGEAATEDLKALRSGDVSRVRGITNMLTGFSRARQTAARSSPTGAAALATDVANPQLLAMNQQRLQAEGANELAAGVDTLAKQTEAGATNNLMNVAGMRTGIGSNLVNFMFDNVRSAQQAAGLTGNASESAWERYKFEKSQKPFWQSALLAGISGGSQAAGAYFGKGAKGPTG